MAFRRYGSKTSYSRRPKRSTYRRRATRIPRKSYGSKRTIFRSIGNPMQKVYFYKRHANDDPVLAEVDGVDVFSSYSFDLSQLPGYTDFTALYDFYKINKVVVTLLPYFNVVSASESSGAGAGAIAGFSSWNNLRIFTAIDYNDNTAPTSIDQIREYQNCKVTKYTRGQTRSFTPRCSLTGDSNADVQYPSLGNPWISTASPGIAHYSMKLGIDTSLLQAGDIAVNDVLCRVEVVYYVSFKSPN